MVWYSHLFKNFPQFFVIHTVKGFSLVNEAEVDFFSAINTYLDKLQMYVITCLLCLFSCYCLEKVATDDVMVGRHH